jgi:hypothetical protein
VAELVDALDSKSSSEKSVGSIPTARTKIFYQWNDIAQLGVTPALGITNYLGDVG